MWPRVYHQRKREHTHHAHARSFASEIASTWVFFYACATPIDVDDLVVR